MANYTKVQCKNIFKNKDTLNKEEYTKIWIKLINKLEQNKDYEKEDNLQTIHNSLE